MLRRIAIGGMLWLAMAILVACTMLTSSNGAVVNMSPMIPNLGLAINLTVFAAASFTDAFRKMTHEFEAAYPGTHVTLCWLSATCAPD